MRRVNIKVYGEIHCDSCNEIFHNHLDCPACGKIYAGSENYGDLNSDEVLICSCGAEFKLLSDHWYGGCEVEWLNASQDTVEQNGHIAQQLKAEIAAVADDLADNIAGCCPTSINRVLLRLRQLSAV